MTLPGLLPCPLIILIASFFAPGTTVLARLTALLMWIQCIVVFFGFGHSILHHSPHVKLYAGFRIDGTTSVFMVLTTIVMAAALTHAVGFFAREALSEHPPTVRSIRQFYGFSALLLLSMYMVIAADNIGLLWVSVEATTLLSAPLVYFHRSRTSLEAAWKYLIICSVGIAFALFGTAIIYSASQRVPGFGDGSLSVYWLTSHASLMPMGMLRLAFVFILLGYGTKAGLFPMHNWLPDAHSEAPAPASAVLSGALLNCALIAIWRVAGIMDAAGQSVFVRNTLLPMSVITVVVASLFLIKQHDIKRLLAYSSMENVGLMGVAIALRSSSGFALQAVNHSLVKVALFLLAGNLLQQFGTKQLSKMRGLLAVSLYQAMLLFAGAIAVAGTPPFGSFLSEWQILSRAADSNSVLTVIALCVCLAIAFIALSVQFSGVILGDEVSSSKEAGIVQASALSAGIVPTILLITSLLLGIALTPAILHLASDISK